MIKRLEIEEEIEYLVMYSSKTIGDFSSSYYNGPYIGLSSETIASESGLVKYLRDMIL